VSSTSPSRRKRVAVAALATAVAISLAACSGDGGRPGSDDGTQGVSDSEIRIGGSFPYSGPLAMFSEADKGIKAYFDYVNDNGGIDGRKIVYTSQDDNYDASRLAANARQAVERDGVAAFMAFGGTNAAILDYMTEQEVPHIVLAGNTEFSQPEKVPYTHAFWPDLAWEAEVMTRYVMDNPGDFPDPQIGLISLNNTLADSHIQGTVDALGSDADRVFPEVNRLRVESTVIDYTSQLTTLRAAGVNVLYMNPGNAGPIGALKYIRDIGWDVKVVLYSVNAGRMQMVEPAGLENVKGAYLPVWQKDPAEPAFAGDEGLERYREIMEEYGGSADADLLTTANGFAAAEALVIALRSIEGEITGAKINDAWLAISGQKSDILIEGSDFTAGPGGRLVYSYQIMQFDGEQWQTKSPVQNVVELGYLK
jgi:branched-chain amino acid transport system substrate-binding protein